MKPIVAVVALLGFFERCQDLPIPHDDGHDHHHHEAGSGGQRDAGPSTPDAGMTVDAGPNTDAGASVDAGPNTDAGGNGDAGPSTPDAALPSDAGAACAFPPGLYTDANCSVLAADLKTYQPLYELWADGADKERYIYLPPDTQIDTVNPDRWNFPAGTRIYKTFLIDGKRLETRLLEKNLPAASIDSWTMTAYVWSDDGRSAMPATATGMTNVLGTNHDIPAQTDCKTCHNMPGADAVNGFGAIQLNHGGGPGWTLRSLIDAELLVNSASDIPNVTIANAIIPGDDGTQAALGYLHGNCGHCHGGPKPRANLSLWSVVGSTSLSDTGVGKTAICQCLTNWRDRVAMDGAKYLLRVAPGDAAHSGIIGRMSVRVVKEQMPPLGTEVVDQAALDTISQFIDSLDANSCNKPCPPPPPPMAGAGGAAAGGAGGSTAP